MHHVFPMLIINKAEVYAWGLTECQQKIDGTPSINSSATACFNV